MAARTLEELQKQYNSVAKEARRGPGPGRRGPHRGGCITKPVRSMRRYPLLDQPVPNGPQSVKNIKGGNLLWIWQNTL